MLLQNKKMLEKRILFLFLNFIFIPLNLFSNEISWPFLGATDYYRATAGERLFFCFPPEKEGTFFIHNDFRYYNFKHYWRGSKKSNLEGYSRFINITSVNYVATNEMILFLRVPYLNVKKKLDYSPDIKKAGFSDIFFGFSYKYAQFGNNNIFLTTGIKLPTGENDFDAQTIPIGTGSLDVPMIVNYNFSYKKMNCFFDLGYIITGKSEIIYPSAYKGKRQDNGDEIFADFAIVHKEDVLSLIFEMNYFYIFDSPDKLYFSDEKYKFSLSPGFILSTRKENFKFQFGYSFDITGRNIYGGHSPVFRVFYKF